MVNSLFCHYNIGQKVVDKFTKSSKIGFSMECFTAGFLQFFTKNIKIWLLNGWLGTHHQMLGTHHQILIIKDFLEVS